jgi:hypothetical protein
MAKRSVLNSVLWNFIGTYMSRYSEYDGYWLFGFLVGDLEELRINALGQDVNEPASPLGTATRLAVNKFSDQCNKAGLSHSQVKEAWLTIRKLPGSARGPVNGRPSDGYRINFTVQAVSDLDRRYSKERSVFIAPHNPKIELRSGAAASPLAE